MALSFYPARNCTTLPEHVKLDTLTEPYGCMAVPRLAGRPVGGSTMLQIRDQRVWVAMLHNGYSWMYGRPTRVAGRVLRADRRVITDRVAGAEVKVGELQAARARLRPTAVGVPRGPVWAGPRAPVAPAAPRAPDWQARDRARLNSVRAVSQRLPETRMHYAAAPAPHYAAAPAPAPAAHHQHVVYNYGQPAWANPLRSYYVPQPRIVYRVSHQHHQHHHVAPSAPRRRSTTRSTTRTRSSRAKAPARARTTKRSKASRSASSRRRAPRRKSKRS